MGFELLAAGFTAGATAAEVTAATAVAGAYVGAAGLATNVYGQYQQSQAQQAAEAARKRQMELENMRQQREVIRRAQVARATALTNTEASGAGDLGSSALPGSYGQITAHQNQQTLGLEQNLEIGNQLFDANAQNAYYGGISSIGKGANQLGETLLNRSDLVGRLFGNSNGRDNPYATLNGGSFRVGT